MSLPGGPPVPRQLFSWAWRVFSTLGSEVNQHGVLEWSDQVNYLHTAQVSKNGRSFISTVNSGPGVPIDAVDPELAGQTAWVELLRVGLLRWNDIDGILPVAKGGTGVSSIPSLRALLNIPESAQGTLPIGGDVGEILQKTGSGDYIVDWQRLSWDDIDGILPINRGGTGSTSSSGARSALGAARSGHSHGNYALGSHIHPVPYLQNLGGVLTLNKGGTGVTSLALLRSLLNIPDAPTGGDLPIGGDVGEILQKTGPGDFAADWQRLSWDDIDGILPVNRGEGLAHRQRAARGTRSTRPSGGTHILASPEILILTRRRALTIYSGRSR